jgi:hypothetical protein
MKKCGKNPGVIKNAGQIAWQVFHRAFFFPGSQSQSEGIYDPFHTISLRTRMKLFFIKMKCFKDLITQDDQSEAKGKDDAVSENFHKEQ